MHHSESVALEIVKLISSYVPFIVVHCDDSEFGMHLAERGALDEPTAICYSPHNGLYRLSDRKPLPGTQRGPEALSYMIERLHSGDTRACIVSALAECPSTSVEFQKIVELAGAAEAANATVVLSCPLDAYRALDGLGVPFDVPGIDTYFRSSIMRMQLFGLEQIGADIEWDDRDKRRLWYMLADMPQSEVFAFFSLLYRKKSAKKADLLELERWKSVSVRMNCGLSFVRANFGADIGLCGFDLLKDQVSKMIVEFDRDLGTEPRELAVPFPRGVLLAGMPGCGKSAAVERIAASTFLPLFRLDLPSYVRADFGRQQERLDVALKEAERQAPCILWADDIEDILMPMDDTERDPAPWLAGRFTQWMRSCGQPVFVLATAHDATRLSEDLFRCGSFDKVFFVDFPGDVERRELFEHFISQYAGDKGSELSVSMLVEISYGLSGAAIERAVAHVAHLVNEDSSIVWNDVVLGRALSSASRREGLSGDRIAKLRNWGKGHAEIASWSGFFD